MITQERLRELLEYFPATGEFIWKRNKGKQIAGTSANRVTDSGYRIVMLDRENYRQHRLAFFYMTGEWPTEFVDHINGDKSDNRWENLRECSKSQNGFNVGTKCTNTSGFKGVSWRQDRNKFRAYTRIKGQIKHLGYFDDPELADLVVTSARELHHGEFARHD